MYNIEASIIDHGRRSRPHKLGSLLMVRWRSWLSHLSNTQKVPGSSPGRITFSEPQRDPLDLFSMKRSFSLDRLWFLDAHLSIQTPDKRGHFTLKQGLHRLSE